MNTPSKLVPLLVVRAAADAIDFYVCALGAKVVARYEHGAERRVSHADLALDNATFSVTEEARDFNSDAPVSLGGSPVVLQLEVSDTIASVQAMCNAGASTVFPVTELFGERMARLRDPFGHLWILSQRLEQLSVDDIQRQRDELFVRFSEHAASAPTPQLESPMTLEHPTEVRQAPNVQESAAPEVKQARVHLVLGPVGSGKSSFALELAKERKAVYLALDAWMTHLFSPDRPETGVLDWYAQRAARVVQQIWRVAEAVVGLGGEVVLELGLLDRASREQFYAQVAKSEQGFALYVLDAAREVRRERVAERNTRQGATFSMVVPEAVFELASDLWEPVTPDECIGRQVRVIRT